MKILTFDIEEWFHLLDFNETRTENEWKKFEVRIYENIERIFQILDETNTKATFFIIGWIAKTYPDVVKRIAEKYEVGTHTMNHQLVWQQSPTEFYRDVETSVKLLEDITGKKVTSFRAPGFSIRETEGWAFEKLTELGITTDCSVFPTSHAHGGMPAFKQVTPSIIDYRGVLIKEFPVSIKKILGRNIVFSGGGYFRLLPYSIIKKWTVEQSEYVLSYMHPRDLDAKQPVLNGLPYHRKFKSYVGLKDCESKLKRYLSDFQFSDIESAKNKIDWNNVPIVKIE